MLSPHTVNTDGWCATRNAFCALLATIVPVRCFLHGFVKIRDRCRKAHELHDRVWEVYHATTAACRERMVTFRTWCQQGSWPKAVLEMVTKLWNRESDYVVSSSHPGCHRTSNLVDRLMNRLTRFLYAGRGLHGHQRPCERRLRGWALLQHFRPFAPRSGKPRPYYSPAHRLNQKQYHVHWRPLRAADHPHRKRYCWLFLVILYTVSVRIRLLVLCRAKVVSRQTCFVIHIREDNLYNSALGTEATGTGEDALPDRSRQLTI